MATFPLTPRCPPACWGVIHFSEVFHEPRGFDILIANPPYLGEKGHKEIFREIKSGCLGEFYLGRMDLFYFFFHLALNLGSYNSQIAFITTNYYTTAQGGRKLRKDFKNRTTINKLVNFNELKIFESALGQHNMITILCKDKCETIVANNSITKRVGVATPLVLNSMLYSEDEKTSYYKVIQKELYDGDDCYIRLTGTSEMSGGIIQEILNKVKLHGVPLKTICNINNGLRSGIDSYEKQGVFILSEEELTTYSLDKNANSSVLKKYFKNSDIDKYFTNMESQLYVIYSSKKTNIDEFPQINKHLVKFQKIIVDKRWGEKIPWYSLVRPRNEKIFSDHKIVCPQRSSINTFGYNEGSWYAGSDVFFITLKNKVRNIDLKYILALLNSKIYYSWLYYRGKRKGEALELIVKPLSEIPIKKISAQEQKPFVTLADQILNVTKDVDYLSSPSKQAKVKELKCQIDQLIYQLYELNPEEIEVVKSSTENIRS